MRYLALACDYDGTIADQGRVSSATVASLKKVCASGRKLILVTGRQLDELLDIFPETNLFDRVVAENGAVLYHPERKETRTLVDSPPQKFIETLRQRGVAPVVMGHVIVATWKPYENIVLETIRDMALELQIIFNKQAVMVLPTGVNKATGLHAALKDLELSAHEVVGVGDAENDIALLNKCECGVAVDNALPTVKQCADLVMAYDHGRGVEALIEELVNTDLQNVLLPRHDFHLGRRKGGEEILMAPYGVNVLIAGPSASGKSTVSKSLLERIHDQRYQFCIIDPEGDYDGLEGAITVGDPSRGPKLEEILQLVQKPDVNVVVNLVGMQLADRPAYFLALMLRLQELRARTGRPHWIVVDETHHLMPTDWTPGYASLPSRPNRMVFITVHPDQIAAPALAAVNHLIAVGADPDKTILNFCQAAKLAPPAVQSSSGDDQAANRVLFWTCDKNVAPVSVQVTETRAEHRRHLRKYAEGELPPERSFYFRGPEKKLNLRVHNSILFNQIAEGLDDATWNHHRQQHDYSRWFRESIHDESLAEETEKIERQTELSAKQSRELIRKLIERNYTVPAAAPLPTEEPQSSAEA